MNPSPTHLLFDMSRGQSVTDHETYCQPIPTYQLTQHTYPRSPIEKFLRLPPSLASSDGEIPNDEEYEDYKKILDAQ